MKKFEVVLAGYIEVVEADKYEIEESVFKTYANDVNIRRDYIFLKGKKIVYRVPVNFVADLRELK